MFIWHAIFALVQGLLLLAQVLFGHSLGSTRLHLFQEARTVTRHALYKDFPEPGQGGVPWFRSDLFTLKPVRGGCNGASHFSTFSKLMF